jgi:myo-inositol-1(or 4)-monophosphatase
MSLPPHAAELDRRLEFTVRAARRAGEILMEGYGRSHQVQWKGDVNLLTEYDLRAEELLVRSIGQDFPGEAILAEEGGQTGSGEARWVVDPLDGTTNFAHGLPLFSISIAWCLGQEPWMGVVYDPTRGEVFRATRGGGARLGERRLSVSTTADLDQALLVTGFPYDIRTNPENNLDHYAAFAVRSRGVRRLGSAALDLAYVAAGRFDGYWEMRLSPWDWSAGVLLVLEAGGRISRVDGAPDIFRLPTSVVASNGRLHEAMLAVLGAAVDRWRPLRAG